MSSCNNTQQRVAGGHSRPVALQHNSLLQRLTRNTSSTISHSQLNGHPALPLNPIPNEPPRNFLSTAAVVAANYCQKNCNCNNNDNNSSNNNNNNISDCSSSLSCAHLDMLKQQQQHANSCGAIPDSCVVVKKKCCNGVHFSQQQQLLQSKHLRSTAGNNNIGTFQRNSKQHLPSQKQHQSQQKRHSTTNRPSTSATNVMTDANRNTQTTNRANMIHRNNKNATTRRSKNCLSDSIPFQEQKQQQHQQNQSTSPYTDVSYIQSSDGTNGSSKAMRAIWNSPPPSLKNLIDYVPPLDDDSQNVIFYCFLINLKNFSNVF